MLLALLAMVAMPMQGLAAISAGMCMALGHVNGLAAAMHGPDSGHDAVAAATTGDSIHEGVDHESETAHCGPCVACCAAAAIPVAGSIFHPNTISGDRVAFVAASTPEYLPELLDRPPLTFGA